MGDKLVKALTENYLFLNNIKLKLSLNLRHIFVPLTATCLKWKQNFKILEYSLIKLFTCFTLSLSFKRT